ncbi:MAG: hypothetical protein IT383_14150 [Deltaproteobacteria bacterium]|nr:hypothetical protein [Deltaproteobacteria bacterium]
MAALSGCISERILVVGHDGKALVSRPAFDKVERSTEELRRLPFKDEVPAEAMTVAEVKAWFDRYAEARKLELAKEDRLYHRLGILPPTLSTAEAYKGFLADFVGGLYDDGAKRMVLVSDYAWWAKAQQDLVGALTGVDWAYEVFLAHELVHALQDQHFGLADQLRGGVYDDNDDAAFVRKTILETDANVAGMAHFFGMDLSRFAVRKAFFLFVRYNNLLNGPLLQLLAGKTPSYFSKQGFSQYELGLSFVERKLDKGGQEELSRAYLRVPGEPGALPESTEQLLWPKKQAAATLDRPVPIAPLLAPPTSVPGSSSISTNVFGALSLKHFLEPLLGALEADAVANGWGGDRYDLFDDEGATLMVWRTTWDSDEDAQQFVDAWTRSVPRRYGERAGAPQVEGARVRFTIPAAPKEARKVRTTRDELIHLERRGRDVLVLEGARAEHVDALVHEGFAALVPGPRAEPDRARIEAKARALEQQLGKLPPPRPRPNLAERLFLPARLMAFRTGAGLGVVHDEGGPLPFPVSDSELRWGMRPGVELALPLALSTSLTTPVGQTVLGLRPRWYPPLALEADVQLGHSLTLHDDLLLAAQLGLHSLGASDSSRSAATGALLRPFPQLVLAPGAALVDEGAAGRRVFLGGALTRGFGAQPLVELEVIDGLFVYESSLLGFDVRERGLRFVVQTHVAGVLLYF